MPLYFKGLISPEPIALIHTVLSDGQSRFYLCVL